MHTSVSCELNNINIIPFCTSNLIGSCIFKALNKTKHKAHTQPETQTHDAGVLQQIHYCTVIFNNIVRVCVAANTLVRFHNITGFISKLLYAKIFKQ